MGPIFVGGASRSGKTLMRWMLTSHSRIAVTRRTELWPRFYEQYGALADDRNLERCLQAMVARRQIAVLEPDVERLRRDLSRRDRTYAQLFALIHEHHAERCGKARWGDQTPSIERFTDQLMSEYPAAKVIHLVRDPRDRHEAVLARGRHRPGAVGRSTAGWLLSAELARRNTARYPDAYRVIRYETLVRRPDETMRDVCEFIGEAFEPQMVSMPAARRYDAERAAAPDGNPLSTAYIGRYRERLSRPDLAFIQAHAGAAMDDFDYRVDALRLTTTERLRSAAVWPLNLIGMGVRDHGRRRELVHAP
jgi:hypothetical protein